MYANLLLKIAQKLDTSKEYKLADKIERIAQDMSVPFYRYPTQQKDSYKNRIPMKENFEKDSKVDIDKKFGQDAKIYLQQMIKDPLLFDHPQSKIMLDTILNDPTYKMDKSSFVKMINEYRSHYEKLNESRNDVKELSILEPELHKHLDNMVSKL
jgi:hypothetical protein